MYLKHNYLLIGKYLVVQKVGGLDFFCYQIICIFLSACLGSYIKWERVIPLSSGGSWEHAIFIFQ